MPSALLRFKLEAPCHSNNRNINIGSILFCGLSGFAQRILIRLLPACCGVFRDSSFLNSAVRNTPAVAAVGVVMYPEHLNMHCIAGLSTADSVGATTSGSELEKSRGTAISM